jgi:glycosyltransferase involved in cell wall biosynthesis
MLTANSVDVIIPTFNSKEWLKTAIESVINQTETVERIIVVDDGSDTEFKEYIDSEIRGMSKVTVITSSHTGLPGKMRGIGLANSTSEWVAFLDADDWWEKDKLAIQLDIALKYKVDFVCTNATSWKNSLNVGQTVECENGFIEKNDLLADNKVINSSVLIRRKIFDLCGEYEASFQTRGVEDYCMWLRYRHFGKIYFVNQDLVNYRIVESSLSRRFHSNPRIFAHINYFRWLRDRKQLTIWQSRKIKKYLLKGL